MIARAARPLPPLAWIAGPAALSLAATLIFAVPARLFGWQAPEPVFGFVPAFAWALAQPSVAAPLVLFLLGLAMDLIWGAPIGLWAFCMVAAYGFVAAPRRFLAGQGFWAQWAWYAGACAIALAAGEGLMAVRAGAWPSLVGVTLQWAISAALFPFAWRLLERHEAARARF